MRITFKVNVVVVVLICLLLVIFVDDACGNGFWVSKTSKPTADAGFEVAVVDEKIYTIATEVSEVYDVTTDTWSTSKPLPTSKQNFVAVACERKIYVIGGTVGSFGYNSETDTWESAYTTNSIEAYDPTTDVWETKTAMPSNRSSASANVVNGKIYVVGGISEAHWGTLSDMNEVYEPATDTWATKSPPPENVSSTSAVIDNKIYFIGHKLLIYDTQTNTWSYGKTPPKTAISVVAASTSGVWAPKRIYYVGPESTQIYDPQTDSWSEGTPMPTKRYSFALAVVKDKLYAIGGVPELLNFAVPPVYNNENEEYTSAEYKTDSIKNSVPSTARSYPTTSSMEPTTGISDSEENRLFSKYIEVGSIVLGLLAIAFAFLIVLHYKKQKQLD